MSNELQKFSFEGNEIRTVIRNGEPWWIASDVCNILDITNTPQAMQRLDSDEISTICLNDSGNLNQNRNIVNESGLYSLILSSRKSEAKSFRKWITSDVIPSIRKTGSYSIPQSHDDQVLMICDQLKAKIIENRALIADNRAKEETITAQAPKVALADECLSSDGNYSIGEVAKHICIGQNNLFDSLRRAGILSMKNEPYQRYIDSGYFKLITKTMKCSWSDTPQIYHQTRVTPRGMAWISLNKEKILGYHVPKKVIRKVKSHNFNFNDNENIEIDINDLLNY